MPRGVFHRSAAYRAKMSAVKKADPRTASNLQHGHTSSKGGKTITSPTWKSWNAMKTRCLNPNAQNYPDYGGRGITVCDKWMTFAAFLADMGERPDGCSLGRINNDGNYEPGNCRWETPIEQNNNRRNGTMGSHPNSRANLTHRGTRASALKAWATKRRKAATHC